MFWFWAKLRQTFGSCCILIMHFLFTSFSPHSQVHTHFCLCVIRHGPRWLPQPIQLVSCCHELPVCSYTVGCCVIVEISCVNMYLGLKMNYILSVLISVGFILTRIRISVWISDSCYLYVIAVVGGHYHRGKTVCENLKMSAPLLSRFDIVRNTLCLFTLFLSIRF